MNSGSSGTLVERLTTDSAFNDSPQKISRKDLYEASLFSLSYNLLATVLAGAPSTHLESKLNLLV